MTIKFVIHEYLAGANGILFPYGSFEDIDTNTFLSAYQFMFDLNVHDTKETILAGIYAQIVSQAITLGYSSFTEKDIINLATDGEAWVSGVKKIGTFDYISSIDTFGGVAAFNLTDDGTPTGNAVFSEVFADSACFLIDDNNDVWSWSGITVSVDKKTLSVTVRRLALSLGLLVWNNAPDGTVVKLTVKGK